MNAHQAQIFLERAVLDSIIKPRRNILTYRNHTLDFNPSDKSLLLHLMKDVKKKFESKCLLHIGTVNMILLQRGCYWNFPFTMKDTFVFTPQLLDHDHSRIVEILIHEMVHIDQKRNQGKYNSYYKVLGFQRYDIDFGELTPYLLDNPDGQKYEWIWQGQYIPCAILNKNKFQPLILQISKNHNSYDDTDYRIFTMEQVPIYNERFGTLRQLYHPNEIVAHIVSDWIGRNKKHIQINYDTLLDVLNS